jgi:hypothetical protein
VQRFGGTEAYKAHKRRRFRQSDNPNIAQNEAFLLSDAKTRALDAKSCERGGALYYADKPTFGQILAEIGKSVGKL